MQILGGFLIMMVCLIAAIGIVYLIYAVVYYPIFPLPNFKRLFTRNREYYPIGYIQTRWKNGMPYRVKKTVFGWRILNQNEGWPKHSRRRY